MCYNVDHIVLCLRIMIIIYNVKVTYSCSKAIAPLFLVSWSPSPLMCEVPWQLVNCLSKFGMLKNLGMRACRKQLFISALLGVIFKVVYAYIGISARPKSGPYIGDYSPEARTKSTEFNGTSYSSDYVLF